MRQRSKGSWQNFFSSTWFIAIGGIVLFFLLFAFGRSYYQQYLVRQEISRLQSEVARLQGQKLETLEALKYMQSPAFAEEKARRELNLVKSGEKMAVINSIGTGVAAGQTDDSVIKSFNIANPIKWWRYFFK